jgi:subtilisin family serine protease
MAGNRAAAISLIVALLSATGLPASAADSAADSANESLPRILITFDVGKTGKSSNTPAPVKSYRYRSRYKVSAKVLGNAAAVATEYELKLIDDWPIESLNVYCVAYEAMRPMSVNLLLQKLNDDPRVESAQELHQFESLAMPLSEYDDSYAGFQHGLESMSVLQAHAIADGKGVSIAVVDSGVDLHHEDFSGSRIRYRSFVSADQESSSTAHGTAVVSLIVANPNNGKGIVGIAPAAKLTALRACWSNGSSETAQCTSFTLAKALDYLVRRPPDLINLSIAGPRDALLGRLLDKALQNGTIVVAAQAQSKNTDSAYPAEHVGVIPISAAVPGNTGASARKSPSDEIRAPGDQIMVALPDDSYGFRSGSSLAAANASGVIALLLELSPDLDAARIADILRNSQIRNEHGGEVINACRALAEIDTAHACQ